MTDLVTFYNVLIALCGGLAAIWGALKIIKEIKKPSIDIARMVEEHEGKLKDDFKRIEKAELNDKMMMRCFLALLNHEISGNDVKNLKALREELTEYITKL